MAAPMKKYVFTAASIKAKGFFCQFVDRKVVGLIPKYYLLAGDTSQVSNFFLA